MNANVLPQNIAEALSLLDEGRTSSVELTKACLSRAKERNAELNAYVELFDDALESARIADERRGAGERGPLLGIPVAVKDNILIRGKRASAGSKMLEPYTAVYDATVIAKLKDAGAVFLGRTNLDEFAMGSSTENSAWGVVHNPHDVTRVPGGSSGGSAVAVSDGSALAALGSDTGGSIRQPASLCGIVGLKPTYGSVSRSGLIAMGSSLDQIGPFAKTVADTKTLFEAIRGHDPLDSTSAPAQDSAISEKRARTVGIPWHFMEKGLDADVLLNFKESVKRLESLGYEIREIKLPRVQYSLPAYYIIMPAEASTNLARFDGVRYGLHEEGSDLLGDYLKTRGRGFGPEVRRRILLGTYVLSAGYYESYYNKAQQTRALIAEDFTEAFRDVGTVLTPTSPTPAFRIGEKADPVSMYLSDIFTVPANLTGSPALSVPSGFVEREGKKLPVGIQFTAPHFAENLLFQTGAEFLGEKNNTTS